MESARRHPGDASVHQAQKQTQARSQNRRPGNRLTCECGTVFQEIAIQVQTDVRLKEFGESFQDLKSRCESQARSGAGDPRAYHIHVNAVSVGPRVLEVLL